MSGEGPPLPPEGAGRVASTIEDVAAAIRGSEWTRVHVLVDQLQSQLDELALTAAEVARRLGFTAMDLLRRQRRYLEGAALGRHLSQMRDPAPLTLHAYALCRLQLGRSDEDTEDLLHRALGSVVDAFDREEILAALGRVYKDRYLGSDGSSPGSRADLDRALVYYGQAYDLRHNYFPGINLAELLVLRAQGLNDGEADAAKHEAQELATSIASEFGALDSVPNGLSEWEYPTLLGCYLVLGEDLGSEGGRLATCLGEMIENARDPFTLDSSRRQLLRSWRGNAVAAQLAARLGQELQARSRWVFSESAEVVIDVNGDATETGVRRGVVVRDESIAGGAPILVTSGDVAWRDTVTCRLAGSLGDIAATLEVASKLIWASSPWILDVALISIADTELGVRPEAALRTAGRGPVELQSWSARSRRTGTANGPLDDEPARNIRCDGRYVRFAVNAVGSAPGAAVLDRNGRLVAVQRRTPNPGQNETTGSSEVEAVLWEAIVDEIRRSGVDTARIT